MKTFQHLSELEPLVGQEIAVSDWLTVEQARIDKFADATGDHQWIHVDPEAAAKGPFGTTVAHGYLTLALLPALLHQLLVVRDARMGVNYGIDKVRFTAPVPSGSEVRLHGKLLGAERRGEGVRYRVGVEIEIRGGD